MAAFTGYMLISYHLIYLSDNLLPSCGSVWLFCSPIHFYVCKSVSLSIKLSFNLACAVLACINIYMKQHNVLM